VRHGRAAVVTTAIRKGPLGNGSPDNDPHANDPHDVGALDFGAGPAIDGG